MATAGSSVLRPCKRLCLLEPRDDRPASSPRPPGRRRRRLPRQLGLATSTHSFLLNEAQPLGHHDGCKITASVTVADGVVYVGDYCRRCFALRSRPGSCLWSSSRKPDLRSFRAGRRAALLPYAGAGPSYAIHFTIARSLWHVSTVGLVTRVPASGRPASTSLLHGTLYRVSAATVAVSLDAYAAGPISVSPTRNRWGGLVGSFGHRSS